MWLVKFAWKNLWRNRSRTAVTISAIFFAVVLSVTTISLQDGVFDNLVRNLVSFYSGYVQVHKAGYWEKQILDNSVEQNPAIENALAKNPNVQAVAPRIESFALSSSGEMTKGCLVVGIVPEAEHKITFLKNKLIMGEYLDPSDDDTNILLAEGLAQQLKLRLSDTIVLISQGYHGTLATGKYAVKGILRFGSPELNNQLLYMTLNSAQNFYAAPNLITAYVLALNSSNDLEKTAEEIESLTGKNFEVKTWKQMMPEVDQHIQTDKGSMYIIQAILYLLISFGIFGTLLMMMAERKNEMGMLIAIGMKKRDLILILMMESVLNVFVGCVSGLIASVPLVLYLKNYPIRFHGEMEDFFQLYGFEPVFPASFNLSIFISQGLIVLLLGFLLSIYPMIKVLKLDPVKAMKK